MKTILLSMAALSALAVAAPAAAQYSSNYDYGTSPEQRIQRLQSTLDADVRSGAVSGSEARRIGDQLYQLRQLEDRYDDDGLSSWERSDLDRRIAAARDQLRYAESTRGSTGAYSYGGYGRGDYDNRAYGNGAYGNDGYDSRSYGNGGYYDNGGDDSARYGNNDYGAYDALGAYANGVYGREYGNESRNYSPSYSGADDNGYRGYAGSSGAYAQRGSGYAGGGGSYRLRVGDQAPSGLGAVPPEFRGLYPDGNLVYYRYQNGAVYQIDRTTNTIRWVGELPY